MHHKILKVAHILRNNSKFEALSRFGFITNGIFHALIGVAIIALTLGTAEAVDQSGVLLPLTRTWYGSGLLVLIVIGLTSLGIWQVTRVIVMRREPHAERKWPKQLSELAKGIAYIVLGLSSLTYIFARATSLTSVAQTQKFATELFKLPAGVIVLFVIGCLIIALGGNFIFRGISRRFLQSLDTKKIKYIKIITILGSIGYIAKGLAFLLVGILFCNASLTHNPGRASGLDGALRMLINLPLGEVVLSLLGVGFIVYAAYCVIRGKYAKL